ncbi:MarR family winged helix-turn-helix transcriptional regulator [Streptomyces sp. NPDC091292]|uniref:MarR family winged helix-turn-helix transcriptional regulator n=1 Tax=Streptomyces sp. NPDC091292 TaxID=3365991 RepID=UPI00382A2789
MEAEERDAGSDRTPGSVSDPARDPARDSVRDSVDDHVARWLPVLPGLDPDIEGAVTRMQKITVRLRRFRERSLVDFALDRHEFDTLHQLIARGGKAAPSDLAADLDLAPASVTGRLDALERRGFVRRAPSTTDRRRVNVEVTEEGRATWLGAMDVVGHEEYRLLGTLSSDERRQLSDLLRRVMRAAEHPPEHPPERKRE